MLPPTFLIQSFYLSLFYLTLYQSLSSAAPPVSSGGLSPNYFPRTILVLATIFAKIIDFVFAISILVIYMIVYQIPITLNILWVIPIFFIQQIFTLGLALFFSAANLLYRDIQYLLSMILLLWMYATPVIYPADLVPDKYRILYQVNLAVIINAYRQEFGGSSKHRFLSLSCLLSPSKLVIFTSNPEKKSLLTIFSALAL